MLQRTRLARRGQAWLFSLALLAVGAGSLEAASGKIHKVLPHFLDRLGRHAVSPSLYERDAYQFFLRKNPDQRSGLAYDVRWKSNDTTEPLRLRLEVRGLKNKNVKIIQRETQVKKKGFFSSWDRLNLTGEDYQAIDEITAWRVTLWSGETMLDEEKSFLW